MIRKFGSHCQSSNKKQVKWVTWAAKLNISPAIVKLDHFELNA